MHRNTIFDCNLFRFLLDKLDLAAILINKQWVSSIEIVGISAKSPPNCKIIGLPGFKKLYVSGSRWKGPKRSRQSEFFSGWESHTTPRTVCITDFSHPAKKLQNRLHLSIYYFVLWQRNRSTSKNYFLNDIFQVV